MLIAGFKTRFLIELIELYGEVFGATEQLRLIGRMPERHQKGFSPNAVIGSRPEFLFLEEVEELLKTLDDSIGGCKSPRFETTVTETMVRNVTRRARSIKEPSLRSNLSRIIPLVEDCWPIRPPTITVDEVPTGLRITLAVLGYSRCTRLLAFQLLGAVKCAKNFATEIAGDDPHTTADFFGDRARIDIHQRSSKRSDPVNREPPFERRTSQRSVRPRCPSLTEQVESILGHRTPSIPAPAPSRPPPSSRPPEQSSRVSGLRPPTPPEFDAPRVSRPLSSSPLSAPRLPALDPPLRRPSSAPGQTPTNKPSEAPSSKTRLESESALSSKTRLESESAPSSSSLCPPSRRGNQSR